ncbi:MAG: hypothetical protein C0485_09885 [Pirellula sp.]|nr:hypothetical protein [Pirellula sp.]
MRVVIISTGVDCCNKDCRSGIRNLPETCRLLEQKNLRVWVAVDFYDKPSDADSSQLLEGSDAGVAAANE